MPRRPGLWKRKEDGWWYTTVNRQQVKLAKDRKEAETAFHELMLRPDAAPADTTRLSVRKLADKFLTHCERTMAASTFKVRLYYLRSFCAHVRRRAVADLRVEHVTAW